MQNPSQNPSMTCMEYDPQHPKPFMLSSAPGFSVKGLGLRVPGQEGFRVYTGFQIFGA